MRRATRPESVVSSGHWRGYRGTDTHGLKSFVRDDIGPIATPERIHVSPGLPKTRSGKIMRRILRKIADGETQELGDVTTLADPGIVEKILESTNVESR